MRSYAIRAFPNHPRASQGSGREGNSHEIPGEGERGGGKEGKIHWKPVEEGEVHACGKVTQEHKHFPLCVLRCVRVQRFSYQRDSFTRTKGRIPMNVYINQTFFSRALTSQFKF
jgi:hypothetical protein